LTTTNAMTPAGEPLRVTILPDERALAKSLALHVAAQLREHPRLVLGLPTGRTPIRLYRELVTLFSNGEADFSLATTFNLDEFAGVQPSDPGSYRTFMEQHLFGHVNLAKERIHFLNGAAGDLEAECARYEREIASVGGIDLQLLGIGTNGHIGFNEPARALAARTHCSRLTPATRRANAPLFGNRISAVPREALSMGMATILHARRIVLVATGATKARCVERMIHGPLNPRLPASFLQLHRQVEVWLDRAAAEHVSASADLE